MKSIQRAGALPIVFVLLALSFATAAGAWQMGGGARKQGNPPDGSDVSGALYSGTLGSQRIVLEITQGNATFKGRYFYMRYGKAIPLKGTRLPDGEFRVREFPDGKPNGAEWLLSASQGEASGFFCKCDVRVPAAPGAKPPLSISMGRAAAGMTYQDLLLDFPLKTDPEVSVGSDVAWALRSDTRFKAAMPQLTRFPDKKVMDKVNAELDAKLKESRLNSAEQFQGDPEATEWEETLTVGLVSREVLSMNRVDFSNSPGTAHPDASTVPLTYDLRTGEIFDFKTFFRESGEIHVDEAKSADEAEYQWPSDPLNRELVKLFLKHEGKPVEGCEDSEEEILSHADNPILCFEKQGLAVGYELSHATQGCGEARIIPYKELGPLVRKDSPLHSLVER
ncbi:MAG: hypothetical protein LAP21_09490 [Acidobacteriia bacterium]|nr:hypothetical protein [Terriglobia bacterium]